MTHYKRIIQLEFNEITPSVVIDLVNKGKLPHFKKVLSTWYYRATTSETEYKHLEPWIQWISAHTGKTFNEHQIFHLSDAAQLRYPQIWETLSDQGIQSGIIGSMNASQGSAQGGLFFPDPWSKEGKTVPAQLQPLWDLISRKVQGHATQPLTIKNIIDGLLVTRKFKLPLSLYAKIALQFIRQSVDPLNRWRMAGLFDLFLSEIFFNVLKTTQYGFYTLFLNSVAHYQHHYWRNYSSNGFDPKITNQDCHIADNPMTMGYELYDQILGKLLSATRNDKNTLIIIASGLSQQPYTESEAQGGMHYYRLIDHQKFLEDLQLTGLRAYPLMSRDWQIMSDDLILLNKAVETLSALTVMGQPLFHINQNDNKSFFIETAITKPCNNTTHINQNDQTLMPFLSAFRHIAVKNAHHSGEGGLWLSGPCGSINTKTVPDKQVFIGELYNLALEGLAK